MKKRLFILAAIIIAAVTTITVVSCKKDKTEEGNTYESVTKNYELSDMDKAMIAFGEKMKAAAKEKSDETMPLGEALNTLSNYQNFTMCDASNYSIEILTDTIYSSLNVSEGQVLLSELNRFYETTKPEILSLFNSLEGSQKAIYSIKNVVDNTQRNDLENYSGTLDVKIITRLIDSIPPVMPNSLSFGPTDYWHEFDSLGKCDPYFCTYVGRDCVTEINTVMKTQISSLGCGNGYIAYLTDEEIYTITAKQMPDPLSPNGRYAWPYRHLWEGIQCVSPDEMNYYLNKVYGKYILEANTNTKIITNIDFVEYFVSSKSEWISALIVSVANVNCIPDIVD